MIKKTSTTKIKMQHKMLQNVCCNATPMFVTIHTTMPKTEKSSEELRKEFGEWLKWQRKSASLAQGAIAQAAPIDRVHLARIEKGDSGTKRDTLISIVEAINQHSKTSHRVDLQEALDRYYGRWEEPSGTNHNEESHEILKGVTVQFDHSVKLSEAEKEKIIEAMKLVAEGVKSRQENKE